MCRVISECCKCVGAGMGTCRNGAKVVREPWSWGVTADSDWGVCSWPWQWLALGKCDRPVCCAWDSKLFCSPFIWYCFTGAYFKSCFTSSCVSNVTLVWYVSTGVTLIIYCHMLENKIVQNNISQTLCSRTPFVFEM